VTAVSYGEADLGLWKVVREHIVNVAEHDVQHAVDSYWNYRCCDGGTKLRGCANKLY